MPKDYWHCNKCNGNFDHGEKCDCNEQTTQTLDTCISCGIYVPEGRQVCSDCESGNGLNKSIGEAFILGVDISRGKDISCLQVSRRTGNTLEIINTFYGEEAEWTYNHLLNNRHHKIEVV